MRPSIRLAAQVGAGVVRRKVLLCAMPLRALDQCQKVLKFVAPPTG
jgi:hypothetical protein